MRKYALTNLLKVTFYILFLLINSIATAQVMEVQVIGGNTISSGSIVTINAGNSLDFRITNIETGNCDALRVRDVQVSNTADFDGGLNNVNGGIKPALCNLNGNQQRYQLDFEVENINSNCTTTSRTLVTIRVRDQADFVFILEVNTAPKIYIVGSNNGDVNHGDITTSDTNGTSFGVVEEGTSVTRTYTITNIGSCPLDVTSVSSSNSDFAASGSLPATIQPNDTVAILVTFTAPMGGVGTQTSIISISNSDNTTFRFTVGAEMFNENIPGPGGVTASFKLWLKSTRGIIEAGSKVSEWQDLGTNDKDAIQTDQAKQPTYLDTATDNINFNPVIKFENDGASLEQYLYNDTNGFYTQDIFIVMTPDVSMSKSSLRNTIFSGVSTGNIGDITGIGFGDYTTKVTDEALTCFIGDEDIYEITGGYGTFSEAGIINFKNNTVIPPTHESALYNASGLATQGSSIGPFTNVDGSPYWIGGNIDRQGSLNGRIAEIFTFSELLDADDRQKVESYLGIKYGITLGSRSSNEAIKNYVNSFGTTIWDATANSGFNYFVAGIGRDSNSDLNQKQSKSLHNGFEVTIGLGGIYETNSANNNEFAKDGDFLVWGNNKGAFSGTNTNIVTISSGVTTSLTRINRKWKIVESNEDVDGDVETVKISILSIVLNSFFTKLETEEYVLIVADDPNFTDGSIIDVLPLTFDGNSNFETWYDFDGIKYFTFGKAANLTENHAINIASGDYLVGERSVNLEGNSFSISAWINCAANVSHRTIMAKGEKFQIRLNTSGNVEVLVDDTTPKYTSNMDVDDGKWHHITFIYDSGTILLYVDGILDKSVQNVVSPSPNANHYAIGAIYIDKNTIINPLLGEIDEVCIWDIVLSQDQIRYLMNQEMEQFNSNGTNYINGKVIPQAILKNEIANLPWTSLRAYYDFNSLYGTSVKDLSGNQLFLRLNCLNKDKSIVGEQTAPLPYTSATNGTWDSSATWSYGTDQMLPNSLGLDGVTMIDWNIVKPLHDITSGNRNISLLGLISNSGTLTIANPNDAQDETNSGQGLVISHYLELDGVIDLVGESQLIQTEGSIVDADSGGYIERDQQGTANSYNYNFWSSSVSTITGNSTTRGTGLPKTNSNYSVSDILNDGTTSSSYKNITFMSSPFAADGAPTDPITISTHWLTKFYGVFDDHYAWEYIDETHILLPGEGFTMKGTSGSVSIATQQNYVFEGVPNNGDITLNFDKISGDIRRLIGNPYPSAIDATEFILDNMSTTVGGNNATGTIFNGALYFWDHFGEENSHHLSDYVGGYATRNIVGGAVAISNDYRINDNQAKGTKTPGRFIPVNQGFFVYTTTGGFQDGNGNPLVTIDKGDIIFKNSQRIFAKEDGSTSLFIKPSKGKKNESLSYSEENNTPTIRLMYNSPLGYHRQIVLGENKNASNKFDLGYDAFMIDVNQEDMYWTFSNNKFVIQGVDRIDETQEFSLGLLVKKSGLITIELDAVENVDSSLKLYIKDTNTNIIYPIDENSPFETYLEAGSYDDRFKLVFQSAQGQLSVDGYDTVSNNLISYFDSESSEIRIINRTAIKILDVSIYNILGQNIKTVTLNSLEDVSIPINTSESVYVMKISTEKGIVNKKIVLD
ncbi:LamG-like jellyroll fold domain-containing protein [Flavivirga aquimarina]|uniref:LamG-like jellyroll fold domain-containing protein n=1 Tax=Flavivirga aquimarina TaxID=2027862 RepID=A0ABT8W663_9FLAO|nr:LamG-like jellyroll fold domain-containing protein [Flavivirga aquimarina]MDO5968608.1 LamG-like jellyroll fold domain-containing protein [Flavivirga aquimarina]